MMQEGAVTSADGVPIRYIATGDGSPALVFVHGWSCDATYWLDTMEAFAPRHHVVAVDLAGHGRSGVGRTEWTVEAFGQDVRTVVEALRLSDVVLVGHSMGGPVAVEAARLLGERVVAVVGVDTMQDVETPPAPELLATWLAEMEADFPTFARSLVRRFFSEDADPTLVERVAADVASAPPEVAVPVFRTLFAYDLAGAFEAVHVPIVCINSSLEPTDVEANRRHAPQFRVVPIEGVGHFPHFERPTEFQRELRRVLDEVAAGAVGPVSIEDPGIQCERLGTPEMGPCVRADAPLGVRDELDVVASCFHTAVVVLENEPGAGEPLTAFLARARAALEACSREVPSGLSRLTVDPGSAVLRLSNGAEVTWATEPPLRDELAGGVTEIYTTYHFRVEGSPETSRTTLTRAIGGE
jgi:pimeloyl-ACP methyl ester carboxylesterase